jgi:hypothetical protein
MTPDLEGRIIDVRAFGAIGDGIADDGAAIDAAFEVAFGSDSRVSGSAEPTEPQGGDGCEHPDDLPPMRGGL